MTFAKQPSLLLLLLLILTLIGLAGHATASDRRHHKTSIGTE